MAIPLPPSIQLPGAYPLPPAVPLAEPTIVLPRVDAPPGVVDSKPPVPTAEDTPPPALTEPTAEADEQIEALQERQRELEREEEEKREAEEAEQRESKAVESQTGESSGNPVAPGRADTPELPPVDLVPELAEVQTVEILGFDIPMPRTEILVTATTTAGVSSVVAVAGTLFATTLFRQLQPILKPIFKTLLKKLAAIRKKPPPKTWARKRLESRPSKRDRTGSQGES